jgi:hypothetical protein
VFESRVLRRIFGAKRDEVIESHANQPPNHTTPTSDARDNIYLRRTLPDHASIQLSYKSILSFNHALLHSLRMDILYPNHVGGMITVCFMF